MGQAARAAGGDALFAVPQITHERRSDGSIVLRSARGLGPVPRSIGVLLERWAAAAPDRVFLAERAASGAWRHLTYEAAGRAANAIGQALLDRGLGPDRPLMILAENGIDHGLMMLGAMHVGVPVVPVSTAYARLSQDYGKLRYIFALVEPGLIYVDEADRYAKALETIGATRLEIGAIEAWPDVTAAVRTDGHVSITTSDAEGTVRRLLAADPALTDLEVRRAGLSEAFAELTQEPAQ